jgi:hypothetical protein
MKKSLDFTSQMVGKKARVFVLGKVFGIVCIVRSLPKSGGVPLMCSTKASSQTIDKAEKACKVFGLVYYLPRAYPRVEEHLHCAPLGKAYKQ